MISLEPYCEVLLLSVYCCFISISLNISLSLAYSPKHSTIQLVNLSEDKFIGLFLLLFLVYEHVFGCCITSCCVFAASLHKRYVFKTLST